MVVPYKTVCSISFKDKDKDKDKYKRRASRVLPSKPSALFPLKLATEKNTLNPVVSGKG